VILDALTKISEVLVDAFGQGYLLVYLLGLYSLGKAATAKKKDFPIGSSSKSTWVEIWFEGTALMALA
jgi:hypothetical protein